MPVVVPSPAAPEPLATVDDVAAGWRALTDDEAARAGVLLARASAILRAKLPGLDDRLATDQVSRDLVVEAVTASVVDRMLTPLSGVQSQSDTTGPFSRTIRWADSSAGFRFPADLLGLLGGGRARVRSVRMVTS